MLQERLFDMSDPFHISVCNDCGMWCNSTKHCSSCNGDDVYPVNSPYAFKLLMSLMATMGVKAVTKPKV